MTSPPVILTFAAHYLPGHKAGGPIRTLASMVDQLGDAFDFRIVAGDRDFGDAKPFDAVTTDVWLPVGRAKVFYRSPGEAGWGALLDSLKAVPFDLIYLNSLFSKTAALRPLIYRRLGLLPDGPVLLAPRGEASSGALAISGSKKRLFLTIARALSLYRGVTFQASSEQEATDIRRVLKTERVETALNLSGRSTAAPLSPPRRVGLPPHGVFLSRISPKKNLLGAIDILSRASSPVALDIYGVVEDEAYWATCLKAIARLPAKVAVRYQRALHPDEVEGVLAPYDFFFLPTRGENYGHVIREALSAGLPVLISDQTPWRDLASKGVGADLPLDAPDRFTAWIEDLRRLDAEQRAAMRRAARALGDDPVAAEANREANRRMLHSALRRSPN